MKIFYSTQHGGESILELVPPPVAGQAWSERVIYGFAGKAHADQCTTSMIADSNGDLFDVTPEGGDSQHGACGVGNGSVFELLEEHGVWRKRVLSDFLPGISPPGGSHPCGLLMSASGALYGGAEDGAYSGSGLIYEIEP